MTTKKDSHAFKMPNWSLLATALPSDEFKGSVPIPIMLGEAIELVGFVRDYWKTERDKKTHAITQRGLDLAGKERLPASTGAELKDLVRQVQMAHTAYQLTVDPKSIAAVKMARGQFVLAEITSTLEWLFKDSVEDERDAQLANLQSAHKADAQTPDALALALEDFATLADLHRKEMDGLGAFDATLIDEARMLANALRALPSTPPVASVASRAALAKRNRLLQLLVARVSLIRAATRFVFRSDSEMLRKVTSAFERKRRAQARRSAMKKEPPANGASLGTAGTAGVVMAGGGH